MVSDNTVSRLPSGLMSSKSYDEMRESKKEEKSAPASEASPSSQGMESAAMSRLPLILALIALLLSAVALYVSLSPASKGLGPSDRAVLKSVTEDLRAIQNKEITLTSPLRTTVFVDKTFPIADVLPSTFSVPISADIPLNATLTAQSSTGQLVPLKVDDRMQIRTTIPLDVNKSYENVQINIHKEIPIETQFSATLKVSAVYGKELNDMIEKLDGLSQGN